MVSWKRGTGFFYQHEVHVEELVPRYGNYLSCGGNCAENKWDRSTTKSKTVLTGGENTEPKSSLCISFINWFDDSWLGNKKQIKLDTRCNKNEKDDKNICWIIDQMDEDDLEDEAETDHLRPNSWQMMTTTTTSYYEGDRTPVSQCAVWYVLVAQSL
jgi:hypothetical protein